MEFPASKTVRNAFPSWSQLVHGILLWQPKLTRTPSNDILSPWRVKLSPKIWTKTREIWPDFTPTSLPGKGSSLKSTLRRGARIEDLWRWHLGEKLGLLWATAFRLKWNEQRTGCRKPGLKSQRQHSPRCVTLGRPINQPFFICKMRLIPPLCRIPSARRSCSGSKEQA